MEDLNDLKVFVRVAESGSFAKAAKHLGISKSSVSRKVSNLEQRLGVALIVRTTRQINITDFGKIYLNSCRRVLSELAEAERLVQEFSNVPSGTIAVHASVATGQYLLADMIEEFLSIYPDISIDLQLSNERINLIGAGIDVALRIGDLPDSSLISRRLGKLSFGPYASQEYLDRIGRPEHPIDLQKHNCLLMPDLPECDLWRLSCEGRIENMKVFGRLQINDFGTLYSLAKKGFGIAVFPENVMRNELKDLVRVLPDWSMRQASFCALHPAHAVSVSKVNVFLNFISQKLCEILDR